MDTLLLQTPSQLPAHLQALRRSRKLTQAEMAKRLGVTQVRYSQMERKPELIATGRLLEILAILQVDLLFKPRGPEKPRKTTPTPTARGVDW